MSKKDTPLWFNRYARFLVYRVLKRNYGTILIQHLDDAVHNVSAEIAATLCIRSIVYA